MRYIATNDAWKRYQDVIISVMCMCDERLHVGFMPWLLHYINLRYATNANGYIPRFLSFLHPALKNLPIIFITESDFGKKHGVESLVIPQTNPGIERSSSEWNTDCPVDLEDTPRCIDLHWDVDEVIKESDKIEIDIPEESEFDYFKDFDKEIERLTNEALEDYENRDCARSGLQMADWLGLYYPYASTHPRSIYIRIDKILNVPTLSHKIGVLSVVLHEIGHAIMDSPSFSPQNHLDELCYYANDEALANAFAYRALQTRLLNKRHPIFNDIKSFMNSQPFVYKLGLQIVTATEIDDFTVKTYIANQCKAKYTNCLANPRMWFYNVNNRFWPFDKYYVKNLISILYR